MGKKTVGKRGNGMEKYENDVSNGASELLMKVEDGVELHNEDKEEEEKKKEKGLEISGDDAELDSGENDGGGDKKDKKKKRHKVGGDDVKLSVSSVEAIIESNVKDKRKEEENKEVLEGGDNDAEYSDNKSEGVIDSGVCMDKKKKKKSKRRYEVSGNDFHGGTGQREAIVEGDADRNSHENEEDKKKRKKRKIEEVFKGQTNPEGQDFTETMKGEESDQKKKKKQCKKEKKGDRVSVMNNVTDGEDRSEREQSDGKMMEKVENLGKEKKRKKNHNDAGVRNIEGHAVVAVDGNKDSKKKKKKKVKSVKNHSEGGHKKVSFSDQVEVYPSSDGPADAKNTQDDGLVRGKRFSKEEDEIVKKAVMSYIEARRLGEEGLNMVLHCRSHPEVKNCWKEIGAALPWRPSESVYYRAHILFQRGENRKWTPEELEFVRKFHEKHGSNWKMLAEALGKHRFHVKDAWRRIKLPNLKKGQWSQEEYQKLFDLVNIDLRMKASEERKSKHGMLRDNISWEAISEKLETRSNALCCMKWYDQLTSPMVAEGKWSDTDDYHLVIALSDLDACCMDDVDWDNLLQNRSGVICQKRWNQMVKHLGSDRNKSFAEQVEILSTRYCSDVLEAREAYTSQPAVK